MHCHMGPTHEVVRKASRTTWRPKIAHISVHSRDTLTSHPIRTDGTSLDIRLIYRLCRDVRYCRQHIGFVRQQVINTVRFSETDQQHGSKVQTIPHVESLDS